jgi:hypothetical protein
MSSKKKLKSANRRSRRTKRRKSLTKSRRASGSRRFTLTPVRCLQSWLRSWLLRKPRGRRRRPRKDLSLLHQRLFGKKSLRRLSADKTRLRIRCVKRPKRRKLKSNGSETRRRLSVGLKTQTTSHLAL